MKSCGFAGITGFISKKRSEFRPGIFRRMPKLCLFRLPSDGQGIEIIQERRKTKYEEK